MKRKKGIQKTRAKGSQEATHGMMAHGIPRNSGGRKKKGRKAKRG